MNKDTKLLWEAYLAEDETTSTGEDIIDALENDPEYQRQQEKHNEDIRMIIFGHVDKAISIEVLSRGETVAFVQIKWVCADSDYPKNKDFGPDKIAKGPVDIMLHLGYCVTGKTSDDGTPAICKAIDRVNTDTSNPNYGTGPDEESEFPW